MADNDNGEHKVIVSTTGLFNGDSEHNMVV